ncbi:helix-turn-helix domain-containing protein [Staphylococcus sp. NRL 16/872]|uniref:helix-turn-helix domain-containing protein n=1 Tax=Staphylococcus sp. NRL 16/872 TaxID=2930131 RepID=UPI001FB4BD94|nr:MULTISPECIES: helix-turn-helix domain-containing protein [unclassified Staphylococcus]MCJ1656482.1 helix-turn-helix domain-containing protein [Staphylococcus sp. NRL 21/187]MCJ1662244.1 helix-turn-helix domain-containing protein [Staphylococcus sp. NRL 18/288]MCJ1668319.1 helix-turn-helix domain-containing protein [Staphylococcus sp. NRL 19/737]WEN68518.1 helix-turn-helix domain-containing protein [Staphylococcus sp. NRL 16/872]
MRTIGETLKGRRERLGMTLAELEDRTQIKRDTLKLIEGNHFNRLAKVDYAEGFIKRYASVVNIDANQLISAHKSEIPSSQNQLDDLLYRYRNNDAPDYRTKNKEPLQLAVIMGGIILITFVLWVLAVLIL